MARGCQGDGNGMAIDGDGMAMASQWDGDGMHVGCELDANKMTMSGKWVAIVHSSRDGCSFEVEASGARHLMWTRRMGQPSTNKPKVNKHLGER